MGWAVVPPTDPSDHRPRRPTFLSLAALEAHGGTHDPLQEIEAAHQTAAVLVHAGRAAHDPVLTARLVALVEELGLSTVADLWAGRPARSLPGALWRLYVLREWVRRDPAEASADYSAGRRFSDVDHIVAGAADPTGPEEVRQLTDAILTGVFEGDLAVALDRAASFCRVVAAGRGERTEGEAAAERAAQLLGTADDLTAAAALWRTEQLI
ncbi:hypothetical protein GCM10009814_14200 [Lapillicoccus jejuensis]|uniref:DNA-directed RNA polymerase subunit beta n=1 Tax=Lapillicoccus jejuensis TaxID=402171 RepID=A0A542E0F8_9MICO|nr:hypothetical protein FB458_1934 [Lapillicoccus jejuensis]